MPVTTCHDPRHGMTKPHAFHTLLRCHCRFTKSQRWGWHLIPSNSCWCQPQPTLPTCIPVYHPTAACVCVCVAQSPVVAHVDAKADAECPSSQSNSQPVPGEGEPAALCGRRKGGRQGQKKKGDFGGCYTPGLPVLLGQQVGWS